MYGLFTKYEWAGGFLHRLNMCMARTFAWPIISDDELVGEVVRPSVKYAAEFCIFSISLWFSSSTGTISFLRWCLRNDNDFPFIESLLINEALLAARGH